MGTWAYGSFGNDTAGDWAIELKENPTFAFLRQSLQESIDNTFDSMANEQAIAAAEVLCILNGQIPADFEEVKHNLEPVIAILKTQQIPKDLKSLALQAVEMIQNESELKELWEEDEEWDEEIHNLKQRLNNSIQLT